MVGKVARLVGAGLLFGGVMSAIAMENPLPTVKVEQVRLSNGLTVFLLENHALPLVAVNVNYMVGSKNETPGHTGFAHLFEHMMFQGSEHHDDDYFKPLQDVGANVNGGTSTDRTRYWELLPSGYLERALWLESDRMGFLLEAMTQDRLSNQISVVQNELRQNYLNRPYGTVWEKMLAVLYPVNHPYHWPTIGSLADLQSSTLEDVKDFFRTYYTPNNASLCIAGDFQPDQAKKLIEKYFGGIPPGPPVSAPGRWVPRLPGEVELALQDRVNLPRTTVAWPTVPLYAADDAALDVFAQVVGGGRTSRLYQKLVYDLQIAQDASLGHRSSQLAGVMVMTLTPRPGHTLDEVEKAAHEVLAGALSGGITPSELERTQTAITADFVRSMQSIGGFGGLSDRVNEYYQLLGRPDAFRWDLQRYLDLTPAAVGEAARRYLGDGRVVARVEPLGTVAASTAPAATSVDRSKMPGKGPEATFTLPARQRFTLGNGLRVVLVEHHEVPLVQFGLVVRGGSAADPDALPGLASLTADLLQEGAGGRTAKELADAVEASGAQLDVSADTDAVIASLSTLRGRMKEALALFTDVVARPDFPPAELERQRKQRLVRLTQLADQPAHVAQVALLRAVFGHHPYGHAALGTARGVKAITLDDVKGFWSRTFTPANATLVVVGDVGRAELEPELAASLGAWKGGPVPTLTLPEPRQHGPRAVYLVDRPGAAQSVIVAGLVGAARTSPDYAALQVLNTVLGGQFVSRLNLDLREDKGYTYGARSRFSFDRVRGSFSASAPVQTAVTVPALEAMLDDLEGIAGPKPVTAAELSYAQGSIVNGYPRRFETPAQIARQLVDVELYGLPDNSLEAYPVQIGKVTPDEEKNVAAATILPAHLAIVVVGDRSAILDGLKRLNLGPVHELDADGEPVTAAAQ